MIDSFIDHIGHFGLYQKRLLCIILLANIPATFHQFGQVFFAANVNFWCTTPDFTDLQCPSSWNLTTHQCEEAKLTFLEVPNAEENCIRYSNLTVESFLNEENPSSGWPTTPCDDWVYDRDQYHSTIIQEWNLVCDDKTKPAISMSIFFTGILFGSFFIGLFSDRFGRKLAFFSSLAVQCIFGFVASFSTSYTMYTCFRFIVAFSNIGVFMINYILVAEWLGPSYRKYAAVCASSMWAVGQMIFAGMAFLIRKWRTLLMVASLSGVLFFSLIPFIPESVRWLITQGKLKEAKAAVEKAAKVNGVESLPEKLFEEADIDEIQKVDEPKQGTVADLFKTANMRFKTLTMMFVWFVISCVYYGLGLSTSSLGVNDYLAFFIGGAVEIPSKILLFIIVDRIGRRHTVCWSMVIAGLGCILTIWTPKGALTTFTAMIGKFCISLAFAAVYLFAAEIFPTPVRSTGIGLSSCSARLGSVLSPLTLELKYIWSPLPYLIFGCLSVVGGITILSLPETTGIKLPETMEDGENFRKRSTTQQQLKPNDVPTTEYKVDVADNQL